MADYDISIAMMDELYSYADFVEDMRKQDEADLEAIMEAFANIDK